MPSSDYTPTTKEVATLLRARTTDAGSNELGIFTDATTPTDTQVEDQVADIVSEVYPLFGQDIPDTIGEEKDALRRSARRAVALGAAASIELSYFPEQVATGRSPYKMYQEKFEQAKKDIAKAISDLGAGDEPGTDEDSQLALSDGFPTDEGGMVGWGTRW